MMGAERKGLGLAMEGVAVGGDLAGTKEVVLADLEAILGREEPEMEAKGRSLP
jgi:hypothetical protein